MSFHPLITGDIHLTDDPRDEYRWDIFRWLRVQGENRGATHVVILGDVTDRKDKHSAALVNRVFDELNELSDHFGVRWLKGNHDYDADPATPFFRWCPAMVDQPREEEIDGDRVLFLPHQRRWKPVQKVAGFDWVFLHQTFSGAIASNGYEMEGANTKLFSKRRIGAACRVISGDIHVPQKIGNITYVGAPHPITFGDSYKPRVLFWDGRKMRSIKRTTIRKATVTITCVDELMEQGFGDGDQIKVKYVLPRRDYHEWGEHKQAVREFCEAEGILLAGCALEKDTGRARLKLADAREHASHTHEETFEAFCREHSVDKALKNTGRGLL